MENNTRELIDFVQANAGLQAVNGVPMAVVPEGYSVRCFEEMLDTPKRKSGRITISDLESFVLVVNKHKGDATTIYRSGTGGKAPVFLAVFNDHEGEGKPAGWRDFSAAYVCPLSIEWQRWSATNARKMTQEEFAQFIEDNLPDVVEPTAAHMLEISRTLEAKKKVNFASGIRLTNGENQLTYEETIEGTAGKGQIKVPEVFTIGIPVFEGGPRYAVKARLRYRIADGGKLTMWYDLERPHKIIEDASNELTAEVEKGTGMKSINGTP